VSGPGQLMALAVAVGIATTVSSSDPARNLARVRLIVTTRATTAAITVAGAAIASYDSAPLDAGGATRTTHTGETLQLSRGAAATSADGQFDIVLNDVPSSGAITWTLTASSDADTDVDVYSINDLSHPTLVDRFSARTRNATFVSEAALIDARGAVRIEPVRPKMVLAHFYPWYTANAWNAPQFADHPLSRYSTDDPADVAGLAREALGAGIDAFAVSWLGHDAGGGDYDRRMRLVLDAVRPTGLQACVLTETFYANPSNSADQTDAQTMLAWLTEVVDVFGSHPAYLHVGGRPVIAVYAASQLDPTVWADLMARLRATGRNPLLIGDFFHSRLIEVFDGEYQYSNVTLAGDALFDVDHTESLRVRTFNLLRHADRRRIWMASVTPGFDDRLLADRPTHVVVDRAGGRVYDAQWAAAVDTAADWVMITSWNEWFENTEVEPSEKYGTLFLDRTRTWAAVFKGAEPPARRPTPLSTSRRN
jgi:hypothetical protein